MKIKRQFLFHFFSLKFIYFDKFSKLCVNKHVKKIFEEKRFSKKEGEIIKCLY